MTGQVTAKSRNDLKDRRKQRRNQRNGKLFLFVWRLVFVSSLSLGISGLMTLPYSMVQNSSEVEVQGNQKISTDKVRDLLEIAYPQQIWRLPIAQLSKHLQKVAPVETVTITRRLFPAKLTVEVTEKEPVAIANTSKGKGYLDKQGAWINHSFYKKEDTTSQKLSLTVIGFEEKYHAEWSLMYNQLRNSDVKVQSVDWRNPNNLILKTELGPAYFGPYNREFSDKLLVLSKMKVLPSHLAANRLVYIDLTNPKKPTVQVIPPPVEKKEEQPSN